MLADANGDAIGELAFEILSSSKMIRVSMRLAASLSQHRGDKRNNYNLQYLRHLQAVVFDK